MSYKPHCDLCDKVMLDGENKPLPGAAVIISVARSDTNVRDAEKTKFFFSGLVCETCLTLKTINGVTLALGDVVEKAFAKLPPKLPPLTDPPLSLD